MSDIEDKLRHMVERLQNKNERLEGEVQVLRDSLGSAEFRIDQELEPRIEAEGRAHDSWATSPERGFSDV